VTNKEFERYKRFSYEKGNEIVQGYITVHEDCPELMDDEKTRYSSLHFADEGRNLIDESFFIILPDSRKKITHIRKIHFKWVKKCHIYGMSRWEDKGGKRESKLNWVLKNIENENA